MTGFYDFLNDHALYVVLLIVLVIWAGIYSYLLRLGKRIGRLEQSVKK